MQKQPKGSCTTILVGKKASIDGSTIIARNDDGHEALDPQKFVVVKPEEQPRKYQSVISKVDIDLPDNPLRYTSTPNAIPDNGVWAAAGINSENIAMTATETITSNSRMLGVDPYAEKGIGEEDMVTLVLPYIHSAREGVERLGSLLKEFGTYEPNAIAFSDKDEIWYLETLGGHHWAAIRIPDDAYVIAPNRLNIDDFDFTSKDTLFSKDLPELIETYHLNPDFEKTNLRHIFGSSTIKDTRYNNPRAWYGQKYFNPEITQDMIDQDLPFICHANRKITIEDVKWVLSSHYQNTPYDAYGYGTEIEKKMYRPIGINRNHSVYILQIRNDVPDEIAGIHWLAFGPNTFNAVVPFYANISDTPACYRDAAADFDPTNMYWLSCTLALLGDSSYDVYSDAKDDFEENTTAEFRTLQIKADKEAMKQTDITTFLTGVNEELATLSLKRATELLGKMVELGSSKMKLRFSLND